MSACYVRCMYCRARRTLKRHPLEYTRVPKCGRPTCRAMQKARGIEQLYYVDKYRLTRERGRGGPRPCMCGWPMAGDGRAYPHRRGSGWCIHNPEVTPEMVAEHFGENP